MDSAGADDLENPIGGVFFSTAVNKTGKAVMSTHWTNFMSWNKFCLRVCFGNNAAEHCQHIYGEFHSAHISHARKILIPLYAYQQT